MPSTTAVDGLYLVRSVLERIGKGAVEAVHNPSFWVGERDPLNPCPYHLPVFEQEIDPVKWLVVLISFFSGLVVGSVFTSPRNPTNSDPSQWLRIRHQDS